MISDRKAAFLFKVAGICLLLSMCIQIYILYKKTLFTKPVVEKTTTETPTPPPGIDHELFFGTNASHFMLKGSYKINYDVVELEEHEFIYIYGLGYGAITHHPDCYCRNENGR